MADQDFVDRDPVSPRQYASQRVFRLVRVSGRDPAQPVRDPVYVHVHADPRLREGDRDHQIRCLATDTRQLEEAVDLIRDSTAVTLCMENELPLIVFNICVRGNIKRIILGEPIGTLVKEGRNAEGASRSG